MRHWRMLKDFPILVSHISSKVSIDDEIQYHIRCASTAFGKLKARVFEGQDLRTETKMMVYRAVILPTLLYGSEAWTTYKKHLRMLEKYH